MSTHHYFIATIPRLPKYQQHNSVRKHPYASPQHMNMLKHSLYIQYGYGEEMMTILHPQKCQHIITSSHYPQITNYLNLGQLGQQCNSVRVRPYAYPQHMNVLKHFLYIQYGCGEVVRGVVQPHSCQHIINSSHHPQPDYPNLGQLVGQQVIQCKGALICLSTAYEHAQTLSIYTTWMLRRSEGSCTASTMSTHHYFIPPFTDYRLPKSGSTWPAVYQ